MPKLRGTVASRMLETQARSANPRRPRPVESFPALLQEAITTAAQRGEVVLTPGSSKAGAQWLVMETRHLIRRMIDTNHPLWAQAAAIMVLPTDGKTVHIVRRDRHLAGVLVEVVETEAVAPINSQGRPDPIEEIMHEAEARAAKGKNA